MTLPASQQHELDAIDDLLQSAEPRLATLFGMFTDLTRLEAMPAVETLPPGSWWARHGMAGPRYRPGWLVHQRHQPRRPGGAGRSRLAQAQRLKRIVVVPLLVVAAMSLVVVSLVSSGPTGRRGCGQVVAAVMASRGTVPGTAGPGGTGCAPRSAQPAAGSR